MDRIKRFLVFSISIYLPFVSIAYFYIKPPLLYGQSGCNTTTTSFQNTSISQQTGNFTTTFDATPNSSNLDQADVGISSGSADSLSDFAVNVRFNASGKIVARNGGSFSSTNTVNYVSGKKYTIRLEVRIPSHTYDVYVTPEGSTETLMANNFAFRTEQNTVTSLNNWGLKISTISSGTLNICNFVAGPQCTTTTQTSFYPTDDSFVQADRNGAGLNARLADRVDLEVQGPDANDINPQEGEARTWFKFNVTGITGSINKSYLKLSTYNEPNSPSLNGGNIHTSTNTSWQEGIISWDNEPPIGPQVGSIGPIDLGQSYTTDIGSVVAGNGLYSFVVKKSSGDQAEYWSKEAPVVTDRPQLILDVCTASTPTPTFTPTPTSTPVSATPWWQMKDGDVISNGRIISLIPSTCILPACNPKLVTDGGGGFPGIASYGSSYDFADGGGSGTVSSTGWLVNTTTESSGSYAYFTSLIPSDVVFNEISAPSINGSFFSNPSHTESPDGFYWFKRTGSLIVIGSNINLGSRKVILFVESGDLNLQSEVHFTNGSGFLMAIVGRNSGGGGGGNINVLSTIANLTGPALEGIYVADNSFSTGGGNQQLWIRGAVTSPNLIFQRSLGAQDGIKPAEYLEYAPDVIVNYPKSLSRKIIIWKETAP